MELFFSNNRCPSCNGDNVVALYESCRSKNTGEWYSGTSGLLCMDCCWHKEFPGRQAFPFYTGKNCEGYEVTNSLWNSWDDDACDIVRAMKNNDGLEDTSDSLNRLKRRRQQEAQREAQRQQEAQQRQREAQQRQREAEQQRQWEAEQQRQWEAQRRQQEAQQRQREAEQQRQWEEQQRQQEAARKRQEAHDESEYTRLMELGKSQCNSGHAGQATTTFHNARKHRDTWALKYWLAHAYMRCPNKADLAQSAVEEATGYIDWCDKEGRTDDTLWDCLLDRARAYVLTDKKSPACDDYFRVGDHYYQEKDYHKANDCYNESLKETNYYSGTESLFRMAYAREQADGNTEDSLRYQIMRYERYLGETNITSRETAQENLAIIQNRLIHLYQNQGDWSKAYALYEKRYNGKGEESDRRNMAKCQENLGNYQQAKRIYEDMFLKHDDSLASLYLYELYQKMSNTAENIHNAVGCGIAAIRLSNKTDTNWIDPIYEYVRKHGTESELNDVLHLCPRFQAIEDRRRAEEARIAQLEEDRRRAEAARIAQLEERARIAHKKQQDELDLILLMF